MHGTLEPQNSCLVVVDVQGRLAQLMNNKEALFKNIRILIQAARILEIPILWCQQFPDALGDTLPQIAELLTDHQPINKSAFSCCGHEDFNKKLNALDRRNVLLCGIETHICIYQTALDLLQSPLVPIVIADATSSRTLENKHIALENLRAKQVEITTTEMLLFQLLKSADHQNFKQIAKLVK